MKMLDLENEGQGQMGEKRDLRPLTENVRFRIGGSRCAIVRGRFQQLDTAGARLSVFRSPLAFFCRMDKYAKCRNRQIFRQPELKYRMERYVATACCLYASTWQQTANSYRRTLEYPQKVWRSSDVEKPDIRHWYDEEILLEPIVHNARKKSQCFWILWILRLEKTSVYDNKCSIKYMV